MDSGGGGGNGHWWALRWETVMAVALSRWATATVAAAQWKARWRRDHYERHIDCGGQQWQRWAMVVQWKAGWQGIRGRAGRWGESIF